MEAITFVASGKHFRPVDAFLQPVFNSRICCFHSILIIQSWRSMITNLFRFKTAVSDRGLCAFLVLQPCTIISATTHTITLNPALTHLTFYFRPIFPWDFLRIALAIAKFNLHIYSIVDFTEQVISNTVHTQWTCTTFIFQVALAAFFTCDNHTPFSAGFPVR